MPADKVTIHPESHPNRRAGESDGRGPRWVGLAALAVVVFALGVLLRSSESGSRPSTTETPATAAVVPGPALQVFTGVPLEDLVPGFTDTITTLTWRAQGIDILRWQPSQSALETMISIDSGDGGVSRSLDASGRWLAEIRESGLVIRTVGNGDGGPEPLVVSGAGAVRSPVWHDTRPGELAWLTCSPDTSAILHTIDVNVPGSSSTHVLEDFPCDDSGVWLARWGDWGLLLDISEGSGTEVLVDSAGTEAARGHLGPEGEWFVGVGPDNATVWTEGPEVAGATSYLVAPDSTSREPVPGLDSAERLETASISPDGSLLALVPVRESNYGSMVRIVATDTGSVIAEIAEPSSWVDGMVWSSDSRFLSYERWPDVTSNWAGVPQDAELAVFDTETGSGAAFSLPGYTAALRSASSTPGPVDDSS